MEVLKPKSWELRRLFKFCCRFSYFINLGYSIILSTSSNQLVHLLIMCVINNIIKCIFQIYNSDLWGSCIYVDQNADCYIQIITYLSTNSFRHVHVCSLLVAMLWL